MAITSTLIQTTAEPISPLLENDLAITVMLFCNNNVPDQFDPTAGIQYLDVHIVKDGESPSIANKVVSQVPIDAGDTFAFSSERLVLSPGDQVYALATDNSVISSTISYVVI